MYKILFLIYIVSFKSELNLAQNNDDRKQLIEDLFSRPANYNNLKDLEEVPTTPSGGLSALERCGEGRDLGKRRCVPYHECDPQTNTIFDRTENKEDVVKNTNGFGLIDIRFGEASLCKSYLDVCCKIGNNNNGETPTSEQPPVRPPTPVPTPSPTTQPNIDNEIPTNNKCGIRNIKGVDFQLKGNFDNEAEYGEFPWMVAILNKHYNPSVDETLAICGGSLITPSVVLTGAHCVLKYKRNDLKIRAGEWDTQTTKERLPYQERDVVNIIAHPEFNPRSLINDVALLVLHKPVKRAEHISTICLPNVNEIINSRECYVTGWGKDVFSKEGKYQVILKKIQLPIVPSPKCQEALRTTRLGQFFELDKSFICAGGEQGKDACTGDGGGPLVCPDPTNPQRYVQAGIVAWGIGCAEQNIPGVYASVAKFRSWIDTQMRNLNLNTRDYIE